VAQHLDQACSTRKTGAAADSTGALVVVATHHLDFGSSQVVSLPKVALQPVDLATGIYSGTIPAHLSPTTVSDWAQAQGLTVVSYDANTGAITVRAPVAAPVPAPAVVASGPTAAQLAAIINQLKAAALKTATLTNPTPVSQAAPPSAPSGLTITTASNGPALHWTAATGNPLYYGIYRSTDPTVGYVFVGKTTALTFIDTTAPRAALYYRVMSTRSCAATGDQCSPSSGLAYTSPLRVPK